MSKTIINIGSLHLSREPDEKPKEDLYLAEVDHDEDRDAIVLKLSNGDVFGIPKDMLRQFMTNETDAVSPFGFDVTHHQEDDDEDDD